MTRLEEVDLEIRLHLIEIEKLFVSGVKLTLLARHPGLEDANVIVTSDDTNEIIKAIRDFENDESTGTGSSKEL